MEYRLSPESLWLRDEEAGYVMPLSVILGTSGKPAYIRVLSSNGITTDFKAYLIKQCNLVLDKNFCAAERWMPIVNFDGSILRSGIVILSWCLTYKTGVLDDYNIVRGGEISSDAIKRVRVDCFSEEQGVFRISFDTLCGMVAQDIKSGIKRFCNLDYNIFVKNARARAVRACFGLLNYNDYGLSAEDYEQDPATLLQYMGVPFDMGQVRLEEGKFNAFTSLRLSNTAGDTVIIPQSIASPFVQASETNCSCIIYPKSVLNWGIKWYNSPVRFSMLNTSTPIPMLSVPNTVLGATLVDITGKCNSDCAILPFNSTQVSNFILSTDNLRCIYFRDTAKYCWRDKLGICRISISAKSPLDCAIIDMNMLTKFSITASGDIKDVYLIDHFPDADLGTADIWKSLAHCVESFKRVHASPRIYKQIIAQYGKVFEKKMTVYTGDGSELVETWR